MRRRRSLSGYALFAILAAATSTTSSVAAPAGSGEREELEGLREEIRQEREALAAEREALAAQRERVDAALERLEATEVEGGALPSVSEGARPRLDVYGFAQTDAIYDFNRVDPDWKATLRPSKIPVNCPEDAGCGNDGETILSVRQSRFGVNGLMPTPIGEIKTKFEFDLFGVGDDAGETTFRLRHAYGELGPILAGQTWSVFMDPDVLPNTIDYWGPVGMVFFRNPQVRWTPYDDEAISAAVAIESPGSALDAGKADTEELQIAGLTFDSWNRFPDLTGHVRLDQEWGHIQFAAIVRYLGYEIRALNGSGPDGWEIGAAGNLSGSFNLFENDQILWQLAGGQGFAAYMNDGGTDLAPNGALTHGKPVPGLGWLVYYNRQWSEYWTSSIGFSEHRQWNTRGQLANAFEVGQYGNVNLLYHPTPGMFVGPEFVWGRRVDNDGEHGVDSRLQVSFHYDFGASIVGREN